MNTDKERIETLLTALETALEIARWALHHAERARSEDVSSQALESAKQDLKALKEYAAFERSQLNEIKP